MVAQKFTRRLAALATAVIVPVLSINTSEANERRSFNAYFNSAYGFCDAKKVARVWGRNIGQAKAVIGTKILNNLTHLIDSDIRSTRNSVTCSWQETDLTYNDARRLANFWGRPTHEAKQKASRMVSEMGTKRFRLVMARALGR